MGIGIKEVAMILKKASLDELEGATIKSVDIEEFLEKSGLSSCLEQYWIITTTKGKIFRILVDDFVVEELEIKDPKDVEKELISKLISTKDPTELIYEYCYEFRSDPNKWRSYFTKDSWSALEYAIYIDCCIHKDTWLVVRDTDEEDSYLEDLDPGRPIGVETLSREALDDLFNVVE